MILAYFLFFSRRYMRTISILFLIVFTIAIFPGDELIKSVVSDEIYTSVGQFFNPLSAFGSDDGVDTYFSRTLSSHVYFSDDTYTLIFGNSLAGHIGLIDPVGETGSDLGVINSINANGIFVTALMYLFYLLMFWQVRHGDWKTFSFVVVLPLMLSFKETGFFTSHATPVLFFLFFYNNSALSFFGQREVYCANSGVTSIRAHE